jgi:hypothetical protein
MATKKLDSIMNKIVEDKFTKVVFNEEFKIMKGIEEYNKFNDKNLERYEQLLKALPLELQPVLRDLCDDYGNMNLLEIGFYFKRGFEFSFFNE